MKLDAIIIGGGPAGAATAIALARQGRSVVVVEKAAFPRRKVCGEFISAASLGLLDELGVGDHVRALAGPEVQRVGLFAAGPAIAASMPSGRAGFGQALGRDVLDGLLLEAAAEAGVTVLQPWQALAVERRGERTMVRVARDGEVQDLSAPVLVAAHGSWEPGSLPTHLPKLHVATDYLGFKNHFRSAELPADLMPLLAFSGGYGGMVWADAGRMSLSCCIRRDALGMVRAMHPGVPAGEAVLRHILANCPAAVPVLAGAEADGPWLAAGPIRPGLRAGYAGGVFRVGNLAGESHPVIAEGISMALQGAWLLASELARVGWDEDGLAQAGQRYSRTWRRQFGLRIVAGSAVAAMASRPLSAALMRQFVGAFPGALFLGARLSGKVAPVPGISSPVRAGP